METSKQHKQALIKAIKAIDKSLALLHNHVGESTAAGFYVEESLLKAISDIRRNRDKIASFVE